MDGVPNLDCTKLPLVLEIWGVNIALTMLINQNGFKKSLPKGVHIEQQMA